MEDPEVRDIKSLRSRIRKLSGEKFVAQLDHICSAAAREADILTFGFIVYDETTPEIRKALRDADYWSAIDVASGDRMLVFALEDRKSFEPRMGHLMSAPAPFASLSESYSNLMKTAFECESRLVYPSVLFFQAQDGQAFNYRLVPLSRGEVHEAATRIQTLFQSISDVLVKVTPENFRNRTEIFELVKEELLRQKYTMYILHGPPVLASFIEAVKNLLFLG